LLLSRPVAHDWIVYVPGSGSDFNRAGSPDRLGLIGGLKYSANFLAMGKPGVYPMYTNRRRFEASFRRATRVQDDLEVLRKLIPDGDNIYLIGYSEGAYLVPEIAVNDPRVRGIALIAGGTRGWTTEEINKARDREKTEQLVAQMLADPRGDRVWEGMSWGTWASYSGNETLESLEKLQIPILSIHGNADDIIDVKTAIADTQALIDSGKSIKHVILKGAGHGFDGRWNQVNAYIQVFIREQMELQDCIRRSAG
jgi:pimeloyl-ACP methyl ester carboxylesterase